MKARAIAAAAITALAGAAGCTAPSDEIGAETIVEGGIVFGTNNGAWTDDGECDDPRFTGTGTDTILLGSDRGSDGADCLALHEAGRIWLWGVDLERGTIEFGDDRSVSANDGLCDDPRFTGPGTSWNWAMTSDERGHDASDCRRAHENEAARLFGVELRREE